MFTIIYDYLSPAAQQDLRKIIDEKLQNVEPFHAWCFMESLRETISLCTSYPQVGRYRPDLWQGLLSKVFKDYVIYYRRADDDIEILSIGRLDDDPNLKKLLSAAEAARQEQSTYHSS